MSFYLLPNLFLNSAQAQTTQSAAPAAPQGAPGGAPPPGGGLFGFFFPLILIFFIFYFLILRPNQKRMKEEQNMIKALNKGDEIFTKAGILGTIVGMNDHIVTLDLGDDVKIKVLRSEIGGSAKKLFEKIQQPEKK